MNRFIDRGASSYSKERARQFCDLGQDSGYGVLSSDE